jgi:Calcineurin-like phosphoesterase
MALSLLVACVGPAEAPQGLAGDTFRIWPYLQQPASDGVLITWFSKTPAMGRLEVTGPGLDTAFIANTTAQLRAEMAYTAQERSQEIPGLPQGSWLLPGPAYQHAVTVRGLMPGQRYRYTVQQGDARFTREFRTAPTASDWQELRFVALSDSETEPRGRVTRREWAPGTGAEGRPAADAASAWAQRFGTAVLDGTPVLRYALTETEGFTENLKVVASRKPDFVLMPGDLVQGSGYQPAWDEFFRHTAGEWGDLLTRVPLIAAMGNWEGFAAINAGYGTSVDRSPVVRSRYRFKTFITGPDNGTPAHRGNYHRIDIGPLTVLTLDSSKGATDDHPNRTPANRKLTGRDFTEVGTDTQSSFRSEDYALAAQRLGLPNDLSPFNEGSTQWRWAEAQLADARSRGRIIFVQFHHAPYSDGEHGLPMNHAQTTGQGGTPLRVYHPLFERFGVVAVFSGHSEMFERSFVDEVADGVGVHYYDVGVAGDGLRGERRSSPGFVEGERSNRLQYNRFSQWSADEHEPERWRIVDGTPQLLEGGKHYGHLEVQLQRVSGNPSVSALVHFRPIHVFPLLDSRYRLIGTESRVYRDTFSVSLDHTGRVRPQRVSDHTPTVSGGSWMPPAASGVGKPVPAGVDR